MHPLDSPPALRASPVPMEAIRGQTEAWRATLRTPLASALSVPVVDRILTPAASPANWGSIMLNGAEIIITPNCCGLDDLRLQQFRIRAVENVVGVAMTNYLEPYQNGQSVDFDSRGNVVVHAGVSEGLYIAPFDLQALRAHRAKTIWGDAYRRPHRYERLIDTDKNDVFRRIDGMGLPWNATERCGGYRQTQRQPMAADPVFGLRWSSSTAARLTEFVPTLIQGNLWGAIS